MASKTPHISLTTDWTRIDNSAAVIAGKVILGIVQIEYCTSQPAVTDLGIPFSAGESFGPITVASGDQVWAKASGGTARIASWQRAAA